MNPVAQPAHPYQSLASLLQGLEVSLSRLWALCSLLLALCSLLSFSACLLLPFLLPLSWAFRLEETLGEDRSWSGQGTELRPVPPREPEGILWQAA